MFLNKLVNGCLFVPYLVLPKTEKHDQRLISQFTNKILRTIKVFHDFRRGKKDLFYRDDHTLFTLTWHNSLFIKFHNNFLHHVAIEVFQSKVTNCVSLFSSGDKLQGVSNGVIRHPKLLH
nr:MAG TPA: hypothetical protein [Caudoviricetes sp.]